MSTPEKNWLKGNFEIPLFYGTTNMKHFNNLPLIIFLFSLLLISLIKASGRIRQKGKAQSNTHSKTLRKSLCLKVSFFPTRLLISPKNRLQFSISYTLDRDASVCVAWQWARQHQNTAHILISKRNTLHPQTLTYRMIVFPRLHNTTHVLLHLRMKPFISYKMWWLSAF